MNWGNLIQKATERYKTNLIDVWTPRPGMQELVMASDAQVIGVGGQAGGGKSDCLFGLAWEKHFLSIAFRYELTQMESHIIGRGDEVFDAVDSHYIGGTKRRWNHPRGRLMLGALKYPGDYRRHKGGGWSGMFFDEATDMLQSEVLAVQTWNRTTKKMIGSKEKLSQSYMFFNPPSDAQGQWVIDHFGPWIDSKHKNRAKDGEIRYFFTHDGVSYELKEPKETDVGGRMIPPESRTFYRSFLDENPDMDDAYRAKLNALPSPMREQMIDGDFDAGRDPEKWQVIPMDWVEQAQARWLPNGRAGQRQNCVGVDVAMRGRARTVLAKRYGYGWFDELVEKKGIETEDGHEIVRLIRQNRERGCKVNIDIVGVGASPYDLLTGDGVPVYGINAAASPTVEFDSTGLLKYGNLRTQLWWEFREALNPNAKRKIALPKNRKLLIELTAPRYKNAGRGLFVEEKEDIWDRIGSTIDGADAVIMAWHRGEPGIPLTLGMGAVKI